MLAVPRNARLFDGPSSLDRVGCACDREKLGRKPLATIASYDVQVLPGVPGKAMIWPGTGRIHIDRDFWSRTTDAQKAAVLAHELAHDEDPNACEHCADARAGARLRWQGFGAQASVDALGSIVSSRSAGASVLEGWKAADAQVRAKASQSSGLRPITQIAPPVGRRGFKSPRAFDDGMSYEQGDYGTSDEMTFAQPSPQTPQAPRAPRAPSSTPAAPSSATGGGTVAVVAGVALLLYALTR